MYKKEFANLLKLIGEQGHEIGKDGRVEVQVSKNNESLDVKISGNAVYVKELKLLLES